jgi:transcription elongation GreA/GreB family factor
MSSLERKRRIVEAVFERVEAELAAATRAAESARDAATHEEAKPENDKDTRSVEAAYLATAQASRAADLRRVINRLKTMTLADFDETTSIGAGALVEVEEQQRIHRYLLLPAAGGMQIQLDDVEVETITVSSPLGSALCGRQVGDDLELETPRGVRELRIRTAE